MLEGIQLVYGNVDLGEYDARLTGQTLRVLMNPTRAFRNAFWQASTAQGSREWLDCLQTILGVETREALEAIIGPMDIEVLMWLFLTITEDYDETAKRYGTLIRAHIFEEWDRYVRERVKKRAMP